MTTSEKTLTPTSILEELKKLGVTHIVWLPDTESRFLYDAVSSDPDIKLVPVCREGEAIPIAMGLILAGQKPVCMIQSTGFYESGDAVRGLALDVGLPLLIFIGYRGFKREGPIVDSAATYLEPVLEAWGMEYHLVETDEDVGRISVAYAETQEQSKPAAVLIGAEYQQG